MGTKILLGKIIIYASIMITPQIISFENRCPDSLNPNNLMHRLCFFLYLFVESVPVCGAGPEAACRESCPCRNACHDQPL